MADISNRGKQAKYIFIHNIVRCGGTMMVQAFEYTDKCVTFCEPSVLDTVTDGWAAAARTGSRSTLDDSDRLARYTMRFLCKPVQNMPGVNTYAVKSKFLINAR